jgi:hypothetical protein
MRLPHLHHAVFERRQLLHLVLQLQDARLGGRVVDPAVATEAEVARALQQQQQQQQSEDAEAEAATPHVRMLQRCTRYVLCMRLTSRVSKTIYNLHRRMCISGLQHNLCCSVDVAHTAFQRL